jgi:glycosyltransferase involved in cell wall biosynthesis
MVQEFERFPRVLVVDHMPFNRLTGTSITLSNLFEGWPKERVAQVYTADIEPSTDVCETFFHLGPDEYFLPVQYQALRLLGWNGRSSLQESPALVRVQSAAGRRPALARLYAHLRPAADLSPLRVPGELVNWMRAFRPDVIYSMLGSVRQMRLVRRAAAVCGVPFVPHFTDDWPATMYSQGELLGAAARAVRTEVGNIIRLAPVGMAISEPMAVEYERRYGIPFSVFVNCVDDSAFGEPRSVPLARNPEEVTKLVYVGALHLERWKSLRRIGQALDELDAPVRLTIHAPEPELARHRDAFAGQRTVCLGPALKPQDIPAVLSAADILVHVESFTEEIRRYTRYSVSTKIPQYLAAGRAIFGHGPEEVASMTHIRTAEAGTVVGTEDRSALVEQLRRLVSDAPLRERLARAGAAYAMRHHRKDRVAARFADVLCMAAGATSRSGDERSVASV